MAVFSNSLVKELASVCVLFEMSAASLPNWALYSHALHNVCNLQHTRVCTKPIIVRYVVSIKLTLHPVQTLLHKLVNTDKTQITIRQRGMGN